MNKIFKVGLIGCGHIAETYFRSQKYFNNIKIIKCADINNNTAQKCASKYGIKALSVKELLKDKAGSICAMDIYTGQIIAMASSPSYDPNKFTHGIGHKDWEEIRDDPLKPLVNKSIAGLYSPGSTLKPLVALAALEFGTIDPEKAIQCKGHKHPYELYGVKYHCWKKHCKNAQHHQCRKTVTG